MPVAQNYPNKPINFIATEVVGSATDIQARIIAKGMAQLLDQPIVVENIFGEPGLDKAIKSAPDGYTIVYGSSGTLALLPHIKKVSFNPLNDLTAVGRFVISPTLLAVNPSLPVKNVQELVGLMKANPGKLKMSTAGAGTTGHFAGEMFIAMAGVKSVVVHYPGGGPAIDAVVKNDSQWTMAPIAGRLPHVRSGKLRALATGAAHRHAGAAPHDEHALEGRHRGLYLVQGLLLRDNQLRTSRLITDFRWRAATRSANASRALTGSSSEVNSPAPCTRSSSRPICRNVLRTR